MSTCLLYLLIMINSSNCVNCSWLKCTAGEKTLILERQVNDLQLEMQQKTAKISELETLSKQQALVIKKMQNQNRRWGKVAKKYVSINEKIQKEKRRKCHALLEEIEKIKEFVDARDHDELHQAMMLAFDKRFIKHKYPPSSNRSTLVTCRRSHLIPLPEDSEDEEGYMSVDIEPFYPLSGNVPTSTDEKERGLRDKPMQ